MVKCRCGDPECKTTIYLDTGDGPLVISGASIATIYFDDDGIYELIAYLEEELKKRKGAE